MYLAADGLRLLSATDRIGDFALDVASDRIYRTAVDFLDITEARFESVIIRSKSQYRIFSYKDGFSSSTSEGLMATKYIAQGGSGVSWGTTLGIRVFVADGIYENEEKLYCLPMMMVIFIRWKTVLVLMVLIYHLYINHLIYL